MADCGFEKDLGNGLKTGIVGLAIGALGWLIFGAVKGGRSFEQSSRRRGASYHTPPSSQRPRNTVGRPYSYTSGGT